MSVYSAADARPLESRCAAQTSVSSAVRWCNVFSETSGHRKQERTLGSLHRSKSSRNCTVTAVTECYTTSAMRLCWLRLRLSCYELTCRTPRVKWTKKVQPARTAREQGACTGCHRGRNCTSCQQLSRSSSSRRHVPAAAPNAKPSTQIPRARFDQSVYARAPAPLATSVHVRGLPAAASYNSCCCSCWCCWTQFLVLVLLAAAASNVRSISQA